MNKINETFSKPLKLKKAVGLLVATGSLTLMTACSTSGGDLFNKATGAFSAVKTGMMVKSSYSMAKDLKNASPAFAGYDSAVVSALVAPRQEVSGVPEAFLSNMQYLLAQDAVATGLPIKVCASNTPCGQRTIAIQFQEEGFNSNIVEKVTMGSRLKGYLLYVDPKSRAVISSQRIEGVNNYEELMRGIHGSFGASMLKTLQAEGEATDSIESSLEALNAVKPIKPGLERTLKAS